MTESGGAHSAKPGAEAIHTETITTPPTGDTRSSDDIRADLADLRVELGDTVEELAHRADVPTRLRAKKDETVERARHGVEQARATVAERAPVVQEKARTTVQEQPALVAGGAALLLLLLILRSRRRRRTKAPAAD